jgi:hypothetical protein
VGTTSYPSWTQSLPGMRLTQHIESRSWLPALTSAMANLRHCPGAIRADAQALSPDSVRSAGGIPRTRFGWACSYLIRPRCRRWRRWWSRCWQMTSLVRGRAVKAVLAWPPSSEFFPRSRPGPVGPKSSRASVCIVGFATAVPRARHGEADCWTSQISALMFAGCLSEAQLNGRHARKFV